MKTSSPTAMSLSIISIVLFSVSWATSDPARDIFLQCLSNHISPSDPILETHTPNNSSFQSALEAYIKNRRFLGPKNPKPLAIIAPSDASHVKATVICAKSHGLQLRIRSGGHDYEGLSYRSNVAFVILDMHNLRSIKIDIKKETAWVQAGATLGELYYHIANKSNVHAFPAGVGLTLGTGGHFSGGGYGNMMRKFGLSVDNIIDAEMVDVNGSILHRKTMGDLFWAIRGGGGASFGVILSWKIKLVRVPPIVTTFNVEKTLKQGATDVVYQWQQIAHNVDRDLFIRAIPRVQSGNGNGEKTFKVSFVGQFLGRADRLIPLINKNFPKLGLQRKDCNEVRWVESTLFWAEFPKGTSIDVLLDRPSKAKNFFKAKSDYVKKVIPKKSLESIWKLMLKNENMLMQWNPYGGRMNEISRNETPFPHRAGYLFKIQYYSFWTNEGADIDTEINLLRQVHHGMTPYVTINPREAFQNYRDLDIGSNPSNETRFDKAKIYGYEYFHENFHRLAKVKARVDPHNFFKHEQSIPPYTAH